MKKLIYLIPLTFFFAQCSGEEQTEATQEDVSLDTTSTDTLIEEVDPVRIDIDVDQLFAKADTTLALPFIVDSVFMDSIMDMEYELEEKMLSNAEALHLGFNMVDNYVTSMSSYSIDDFILIDSLKMKGEYEKYQEGLDLGQTKRAMAAVIGKITILGETDFLIWMTDYATYEACPYGHGTYVWATIFESGKATNTILLGENSGGSDAPYWGSTMTTSTLEATQVLTKSVDEQGGDYNEETDEEIINRSEKDLTTYITYGWFEPEVVEE